jgi:hypothetical protein
MTDLTNNFMWKFQTQCIIKGKEDRCNSKKTVPVVEYSL